MILPLKLVFSGQSLVIIAVMEMSVTVKKSLNISDLQKSHVNDLTEKNKMLETMNKRIDNLEVLLNEKDGLVQENLRLRSEAAETKATVSSYEGRLSELQVELQGVKSQLNELLGVYDDLQVFVLKF